MVYYLFGVLTGMLVAMIIFMVALRAKPKIERMAHQLQSGFQERGKIIEPENEELQNWVDSLKNE